jgi:hypothetical protein
MSKPFEKLGEKLLRAGVAPRHVRAYLTELRDHLVDLTERESAAGADAPDALHRAHAALGDDDTLAAALLSRPRLRSMTARVPWLVFGILPPLTILLAAAVLTLAALMCLSGLNVIGRHAVAAPPWLPATTQAMVLASNLMVVPAIAALFIAIARCQRLRLLWPMLAVLLIAALSLHWENDPHVRDPQGWGAIMATYHYSGISIRVSVTPVFLQAWWKAMAAHGFMLTAQYALTLLPLAWLLRRQRKDVVAS